MKYFETILFGLAAALFFTAPVSAETYSKEKYSSGGFNVRSAVLTSGSGLGKGDVFDSSAGLVLYTSGTVTGQLQVTPVLPDGSPGGAPSQTITVNQATPTIVSWTGPLPFTGLRITPVGGLSGTNSVTIKIIQSK